MRRLCLARTHRACCWRVACCLFVCLRCMRVRVCVCSINRCDVGLCIHALCVFSSLFFLDIPLVTLLRCLCYHTHTHTHSSASLRRWPQSPGGASTGRPASTGRAASVASAGTAPGTPSADDPVKRMLAQRLESLLSQNVAVREKVRWRWRVVCVSCCVLPRVFGGAPFTVHACGHDGHSRPCVSVCVCVADCR